MVKEEKSWRYVIVVNTDEPELIERLLGDSYLSSSKRIKFFRADPFNDVKEALIDTYDKTQIPEEKYIARPHHSKIGHCNVMGDEIDVLMCDCGREISGDIISVGNDRGHHRFSGKCKNGHDVDLYV